MAERLAAVRARIADLGRDPAGIAIVAVTKGRPVETCRAALGAGLRILAENRVQEALPKIDALPDATWHLVGHLQTNKARHAARFAMIQSVDSERLARAIARHDPRVPCLLEVNVSGRPERSGCAPEAAVATAKQVAAHLDVLGLMCVASVGDTAPAEFELLRTLRDRCQYELGVAMPVLSMGMTDDWEAAVSAGSSMLRLGRFLFA